jgi:hypothetical protein
MRMFECLMVARDIMRCLFHHNVNVARLCNRRCVDLHIVKRRNVLQPERGIKIIL